MDYDLHMPHPLRSWDDNALYHLIFKGNFGQPIVCDSEERGELQRRLGVVAAKYDVIVLAFCCMDTHVHLLIRVGRGDASKAMQELIGGFARWRNRRHRVRGNLFRSRFWSKLVRDDGQLLVTARYIELNPVAAGMRRSPEEWQWSSCRANLGRARPPGFLARAQFLRIFGSDPAKARDRYERFLRAGIPAARAKFSGPQVRATMLPEVPTWIDLPTQA
jgi:REP element-mobilizing transposase RayT